MRYGKGPSGIIGSTLNESTLAIWALSLGIFGQLKNDKESMQEGDTQTIITSHKEEQSTCIKSDAADGMKNTSNTTTCIDLFDSSSFPNGLVNIISGQITADITVNADNTLNIGTDQITNVSGQLFTTN